MLEYAKKLRRAVLGKVRLNRIKIGGTNISAGKNVYCAAYCRASRGRTIRLGDNFYMGFGCHLGANIDAGDDVMFASTVAVVGGDHRIDYIEGPIRDSGREDFKTATFGDGCWVGHGAIILHGVNVGAGAVVAAGAVVTKNVEPFSVVAGNPAKLVRYRKGCVDS